MSSLPHVHDLNLSLNDNYNNVKRKRLVVIGAGPSGLACIRAFYSAKLNGHNIPEIICLEKQNNWGGMWNYTWRTGIDQYGENVHNSMYRYLWSNGPKECLEFADYSFEEHFGKTISSFPPREVLWDYIQGRIIKNIPDNFIKECILFNNVVRFVKFNQSNKLFTVTVHDLRENKTYEIYDVDNVINASGHFSTPNIPHFDGIEEFNGRVLHSHDFRNALEFKGKDVLVVGGSYSAEDIGSQCWKYGAKSITISYRTKALGYKWPDNWSEHPLLKKIVGNTCYFVDGTKKNIDAIILCTGYLHHYPYLPDDLRLTSSNRLFPNGLYKGVVWENNPHFFYIGAQDQFFTFNMFDVQAWYVRDIILGKIKLPNKENMIADSNKWIEREEVLKGPYEQILYQGEYIKDIIKDTDYPKFDIDGVCETFFEWEKEKKKDIMKFRDVSYKSLITGNMQPKHHTIWLLAIDDSMESYMKKN